MSVIHRLVMLAAVCGVVAGHGAIVSPRSRNSLDYRVGVNTEMCANLTGAKCENGQASFWYSQVRGYSAGLPGWLSECRWEKWVIGAWYVGD